MNYAQYSDLLNKLNHMMFIGQISIADGRKQLKEAWELYKDFLKGGEVSNVR